MKRVLLLLASVMFLAGSAFASPAQAASSGFTVTGTTNISGSEILIKSDPTLRPTCSFYAATAPVQENGSFVVQVDRILVPKGQSRTTCRFAVVGGVQNLTSHGAETVCEFGVIMDGTIEPNGSISSGAGNKDCSSDSLVALAESPSDPSEGFWSQTRPVLLQFGLIVVALGFGVVCFWIYLNLVRKVARSAAAKGRAHQTWFWLSFFFLIPAAIVVAIMGPQSKVVVEYPRRDSSERLAPNQQPSLTLDDKHKNCPFCGEQILAVAKKCKHCGEFLEEGVPR